MKLIYNHKKEKEMTTETCDKNFLDLIKNSTKISDEDETLKKEILISTKQKLGDIIKNRKKRWIISLFENRTGLGSCLICRSGTEAIRIFVTLYSETNTKKHFYSVSYGRISYYKLDSESLIKRLSSLLTLVEENK